MVIEKVAPTAVRSKSATLEDRFGLTNWRARGEVTLWYDAKDSLVSVNVVNNPVDENVVQKTFNIACENHELYQLRLADFDLTTSQDACQYYR